MEADIDAESIKQRMVKRKYAQCGILGPPGHRRKPDVVYMGSMLFGVSDLRPVQAKKPGQKGAVTDAGWADDIGSAGGCVLFYGFSQAGSTETGAWAVYT